MGKFEPGQSGNPKGRPRTAEMREACREHTPEALERLVKLMRNRSPRIQLLAIKELLARAYGQPVSTADVIFADARDAAAGALDRDNINDADRVKALNVLLARLRPDLANDWPVKPEAMN
jgi:hypothetical protein